ICMRCGNIPQHDPRSQFFVLSRNEGEPGVNEPHQNRIEKDRQQDAVGDDRPVAQSGPDLPAVQNLDVSKIHPLIRSIRGLGQTMLTHATLSVESPESSALSSMGAYRRRSSAVPAIIVETVG